MPSTCTCCDCSGAPTRPFIHENGMACAECRLDHGKRGGAISRELAFCYFVSGDMQEASRYVEEALQNHGDNPYMVDLWAQIATRQRDEAAARKALERLEIIELFPNK